MPPLRTLSLLAAVAAILGLSACGSGGSASTTSTSGGAGVSAGQAPAGSAAEAGKGEGGGSSSSAGRDSTAGGKTAAANDSGSKKPANGGGESEHPAFKPRPHKDSGGGAGQFEVKGGDNSIQEFGGEASTSELDEAAAALHGYLDARAAGAWSAACGYLAAGAGRMLVEQLGGGQGGCAEVLAGLSGGVPESVLRQAAVADVGALRVQGERGYLLFHGAEDTAYFIPVVREGGKWKVAAIAPSALG